MEAEEELQSIGAFARRVGLAPSALRFYDDCGVLVPAEVDPRTGYRWYRTAQEDRARRLRDLREAGLPLADVQVVLDGAPAIARAVLADRMSALHVESIAAERALRRALGDLAIEGAVSTIVVDGADLASAARQVVPAASVDGVHDALTCVALEVEGTELRLVATDRYQLAVRTVHARSIDGPPRQVLLAVADVTRLAAWTAHAPEVSIEVVQDHLHVRGPGGRRTVPTVTATFPAYRQVLDAVGPPSARLVLDRMALRGAVARTRSAVVELVPGVDHVIVRAGASPQTSVPATVVSDERPPSIGFRPVTLLPTLDASIGPDVLFDVVAPDRPVLVRSADHGAFTTLVMPCAIPV